MKFLNCILIFPKTFERAIFIGTINEEIISLKGELKKDSWLLKGVEVVSARAIFERLGARVRVFT